MPRKLGPPLAILILVLVGGCSDSDVDWFGAPQQIVGSGTIVGEDRPVRGFNVVTFASEGVLEITMGLAEALRITTDDNLLPYLVTEVQGGNLSISTQGGFDLLPSSTVEFDLTAVDLGAIQHVGVGGIEIDGLSRSALSLILGGVGRLNATNLSLDDLEATLSGVGDIVVAGTAETQDITFTGVGTYDALDLDGVAAAVVHTGVGSVLVRVSDALDVTIVGDGVVQYIGDPALTVSISGNGVVEPYPGLARGR